MALSITLSNGSLVIDSQSVNTSSSIATKKYVDNNKGSCASNCTNTCSTNSCNTVSCSSGTCGCGGCSCSCSQGSNW
jgi:hypothetical protein